MANRNAGHLAGEVNNGTKDVSFLPYDFDASLLTTEKREQFDAFLKESGRKPSVVETDEDASKKTTKTKRG